MPVQVNDPASALATRQRPVRGLSSKSAWQVQVPAAEQVPAMAPTPPMGPSLHDIATPGVQLAPASGHDQPVAVQVQFAGGRPTHAHCVEGMVPCGQVHWPAVQVD